MRGALAALIATALLTAPVRADEHLTGTVLMAWGSGQAVVHHAAFGAMPSMTMTFRVLPPVRLKPGDRIAADVDRTTEPWTLRDVHVLAPAVSAASAPDLPLARVGERAPDVAFVDQRNRPLSLRALAGKPYAISFIYTRCDDARMCPLVSAKFRLLQQRLQGAAALVEVSLDPAYDRPLVLATYAAGYGADPARWHLLTGDPRAVLDFAARFGILEEAAGAVKIVHSERLAIVGPTGRIVRFYENAAWSPDEVLRALKG